MAPAGVGESSRPKLTSLRVVKKNDDRPQLVVPTMAILEKLNSCPSPRGERSLTGSKRVTFSDKDDAIAYAVRQDGDYSFESIESPAPGRTEWPPAYWFNGLPGQKLRRNNPVKRSGPEAFQDGSEIPNPSGLEPQGINVFRSYDDDQLFTIFTKTGSDYVVPEKSPELSTFEVPSRKRTFLNGILNYNTESDREFNELQAAFSRMRALILRGHVLVENEIDNGLHPTMKIEHGKVDPPFDGSEIIYPYLMQALQSY